MCLLLPVTIHHATGVNWLCTCVAMSRLFMQCQDTAGRCLYNPFSLSLSLSPNSSFWLNFIANGNSESKLPAFSVWVLSISKFSHKPDELTLRTQAATIRLNIHDSPMFFFSFRSSQFESLFRFFLRLCKWIIWHFQFYFNPSSLYATISPFRSLSSVNTEHSLTKSIANSDLIF